MKYNEAEELELLSQGDEQAFDRIYNRYKTRIFATALRFLKSREHAQEIVQEVFLRVWIGRHNFQNVKSAEAYIVTMARNYTISFQDKLIKDRARQFEYTVLKGKGEIPGGHELIEKENDQILAQSMDLLTPQQRRVFDLSRIDGKTHEAIAKELNISENTVNNHIKKSLQTIRNFLNPHIGIFTWLTLASLFSL